MSKEERQKLLDAMIQDLTGIIVSMEQARPYTQSEKYVKACKVAVDKLSAKYKPYTSEGTGMYMLLVKYMHWSLQRTPYKASDAMIQSIRDALREFGRYVHWTESVMTAIGADDAVDLWVPLVQMLHQKSDTIQVQHPEVPVLREMCDSYTQRQFDRVLRQSKYI